jgi:hypothetical protein
LTIMSQFERKIEGTINTLQAVFSSDMRQALQLDKDALRIINSTQSEWPEAAVKKVRKELLANDGPSVDSTEFRKKSEIQKEITVGVLAGALAHDHRDWVRNAAAQALESVFHPVALDKLACAAFDESGLVSRTAIGALFGTLERAALVRGRKSEYCESISNAVLGALRQREWPCGSQFDECENNKALTGIVGGAPRDRLHAVLIECSVKGNINKPLVSLITERKYSQADRCRALHLCYFQGPERQGIYAAAAKVASNEFEPTLVRRYADRLACIGFKLDYDPCFDFESINSLEERDNKWSPF